jgi:hypothetical protein
MTALGNITANHRVNRAFWPLFAPISPNSLIFATFYAGVLFHLHCMETMQFPDV